MTMEERARQWAMHVEFFDGTVEVLVDDDDAYDEARDARLVDEAERRVV